MTSSKPEIKINSKLDIKRFGKIVAPHQAGLWGALACSIISAGIEVSIPALLKPLFDNIGPMDNSILRNMPWWIVPLIIVSLFSLRAFTNYASSYVMTWSISRIVLNIRNMLFQHILYVDPKVFETNPASRLINVVSLETQNAVNALVGSVQTFVKEGLTLIGLLGFLLWLNWKLTLIAFVVLPLVGVAVKFTRKRLDHVVFSSQRGMDNLTYTLEENVLAYRIVRLYGVQPLQNERFKTDNKFLRRMLMQMTSVGNLLTPITQVLASIAIATIVGIALKEATVEGGTLTLGGFTAYIATLLLTVPRAKALSDVYPGIQRGTMAINRIFGLLDEPLEDDEGTYEVERTKGALTFSNLTKTYDQSERPALDNINFSVAAGETVALVGHSGSGKTTLVNMLPRFIEPTLGTIMLDGVPLSEWKLASLRQQMAMVSQDVVLFNDTIAGNVALGTDGENIDRERVNKALSMAHLLKFVESLPNGIDTITGHNGYTLSGGQRQRLAIARALYRDAPILILDEATSALDAESERLVQLALESLTHERTTLIVAHRLSTIRNANRIVVLDEGRVIEIGTYQELVERNGAFARLVEAQSAMQNAADVIDENLGTSTNTIL